MPKAPLACHVFHAADRSDAPQPPFGPFSDASILKRGEISIVTKRQSVEQCCCRIGDQGLQGCPWEGDLAQAENCAGSGDPSPPPLV